MQKRDLEKILVIDDDEPILEAFYSFLSDSDFNVILANNGELGLKKYEDESPDLIILDLLMPNISGFDMLRKIDTEKTPVIVCSGAGENDYIVDAFNLGAIEYLTKPILNLNIFHHKINRVWNEHNIKLDNLILQEYREQSLFENTGSASVIIDSNTTLLKVNSEFCNLSGYSKEEIEGKLKFPDFVNPEDLDWMINQHNMRRTKENIASNNYDFSFIDRFGNLKYVSLTVDMIKGTNQSFASLHDITKRKKAEQDLRDSEEKFRAITQSALDPIIIVNKKGIIEFWNDAAAETFGYSNEEIIGKNVHDYLMPRRYFNQFNEGMQRFTESGMGNVIGKLLELYANHKKGHELPIEIKVSPFKHKGELKFSGIIRDITERKKVEEKERYHYFHDDTTGLPNYETFKELISEFEQAPLKKAGLLVADIDGLKFESYDDLEYGNKLLMDAAWIISKHIKKNHVAMRLIDADFYIAAKSPKAYELEELMMGIRHEIEEYNKENTNKISMSLGLAYGNTHHFKEMQKNARSYMNAEKKLKQSSSLYQVVETLEAVLNFKDPHTEIHGYRLGDLARKFTRYLGKDEKTQNEVGLIAKFHDLGKIAIADEILLKPSRLTESEYEIMKKHAEYGYQLADLVKLLKPIKNFIRAHHEMYDGKGYPDGLMGEDIPIQSRIINLVDSYDAMISERVYNKNPKSPEEALVEIKRCSGTQFDPNLAEKFIEFINDKDYFKIEK